MVLTLATAGATALAAGSAAGADAGYTVQTLHFKTLVGPGGDQACDVVGDLYVPSTASRAHRAPALLTTNGFGGSKDDQAGMGAAFAKLGYVVLSYSGLGFGGSGCKITLDDPDYDGKAASQLVSYLGGAPGIAFADAAHTIAEPALDVVQLDARDHSGVPESHDPRVGMIGGSYGGEIQLAAASIDQRIDTIVPLITWNDLSYSLAPNNTSQITPTGVSTVVPGAAKLNWALGFSALGMVDGAQNAQADPNRLVGCPNFASFVCPALVTAAALGTITPGTVADLRHASVTDYVGRVRVPTFLIQGQSDTLFNLNEAAATFESLRAQGTPVTMAWSQYGHSGPAAPGELDLAAPLTNYLGQRVVGWFDHYLKGVRGGTGPLFSYFRDWIDYTGNAAPAYAQSSTYPVADFKTFYLSGNGDLSEAAGAIQPGTQTFVTPPAGVPTSTDPLDVFGDYLPLPENDLPGTTASYTSGALTQPLTVVGSPVLDLKVGTPVPTITLFVKVLDVDPSGHATMIHDLIAPVRITNPDRVVTVRLPAFVHRFAAGHRVRLVVAGGSTNYRGNLVPSAVQIAAGAATQQLRLPVVTSEQPSAGNSGNPGTTGSRG
jgi:putative CocE/NonD family hydrolase